MAAVLQSIFLSSVALNLVSLLLGVKLISKRGGFSYLTSKVLPNSGTESSSPYSSFSPFYWHRKSQLDLLPPEANAIVFLGDSLTNEAEWQELLGNARVKNRGISADTTTGLFARLQPILVTNPEKIFLMIGINDLLNQQRSTTDVLDSYRKILTKIQSQCPNTIVFVESLLPINRSLARSTFSNHTIADLNAQLKSLAAEFSYPYLDIFSHLVDEHYELSDQYTSDGVHLNGLGYQQWQQVVASHI
ncbi:MAG: SGNH/GDSL hydrolase family protein [Elainellaceae cyanobacterium]